MGWRPGGSTASADGARESGKLQAWGPAWATMKIGLVLSTDEPELAWNALRLGNAAVAKGHDVELFLLGRGVRLEQLDQQGFDVAAQLRLLVERRGRVRSCGTCLEVRGMEGSAACPPSTMAHLLGMVEECDQVLTFG